MTLTIKIEMNSLHTAKTQLLAGLTMVDELAKTYETTFNEASSVEEKPKATRKPRVTKKAPVKDEVVAKESKETKEVSEPAKEEKIVEEAPETILTLADMTALAKEAVAGSDRDQVKELIASYGKGKLSSVDTDKFEALAADLRGLAA